MKRRTILLADDSPTIRRLVTQTFAEANFNVVEVSNGEAAIKILEEIRPSVVLADIYMPGKNGYEVCAFVRKHPTLNQTPVMLLVGAFEAFDELTAKQSGATAYITKPFEPGALIELIMSILPPESDEAPEAEEPRAAEIVAPAPSPPTPAAMFEPAEADLLGLEIIFKEEPRSDAQSSVTMTEEDIDRIADRVIQRLSSQVIESIAWDIVPDITEKIVREELKRIHET